MARKLFQSRAKAVEFDLEALTNDDEVKSGFLCLSESTWELAYNLVLSYGDWRSRYFVTNPMTGDLEQITDEEYEQTVLPLYYKAVEELNMSGCNDLVTSVDNLTAQVGLINVALQGQSGCGCDGGEFDPEALGDDDAPIGEGEQFGDFGEYLAAKCETANIIVDKIQYVVRSLDATPVDVLLIGGISGASAILAGLLLAGPAGWATVLALGAVSGLLILLVQAGASDLGDIDTAISANQDDLVCSLYTATTAADAKTAFLAILDGASIGAVGQGIVGFMLFNDVLNQLFLPIGTYIGQVYEYLNDDYNATDCADCGPTCTTFYSFDADAESWQFSDQSSGGNVATGVWDATKGALQGDGDSGSGSGTARARWKFDPGGVFWQEGTTITLRHSGPADGNALSYRIGALGQMGTQEALQDNQTEPGEFTLTLEGNDNYTEIWVQAARGAPSSDFETFFLDVCVVEA